jgi:hypothetical protein
MAGCAAALEPGTRWIRDAPSSTAAIPWRIRGKIQKQSVETLILKGMRVVGMVMDLDLRMVLPLT